VDVCERLASNGSQESAWDSLAKLAAVDGAAQLQAAVPLVRRLRDRRRDVEPGCVQQEYDRLLNQDPAQKFFAQVKATGGGADVWSNLRWVSYPELDAQLSQQFQEPLRRSCGFNADDHSPFQASVKTRVLHSLHRKASSRRTRRFPCPSFYDLLSCAQIAAVGYRKVYSLRGRLSL
jgi:hypothetical protein